MKLRIAAVVSVATALAWAGPALAAHPEHDQSAPHTHGPDGKRLDKRGIAPAGPYDVDAHAPWAASQYDGLTTAADQPDLTSLPTVHAIYLYPLDGVNRFSQFAAMFQADARQATGLIASLYGRGVRFDERLGADSVSRYLDITVLRSANRAKQLSGGKQFNLVYNELLSRGFTNPDKKYVVWLDAGSKYCGQAQLWQDARRSAVNYNERRTMAIVYRPYTTDDPATGGFCRGRTLLHEVGHNLGALQRTAPNAFDGAHCDDSAEDVMCYRSETSVDTGPAAFDYGNDDYWDPLAGAGGAGKLGWWSVNLSRFVCPPTGCGDPNSDPGY